MATRRDAGERMSKVDTAWLRMDSQSNLMMIVGVWTLRPGITRDALCERVRDRLLAYARFRQRVEEDATGARWVEHAPLDMDHHVRSESLLTASHARTRRRRSGADASPTASQETKW